MAWAMNLEMIRQFQKANALESSLIGTNHSSRTCKRFTKAETAWLQSNSTKYTANEAGLHLGHKTNTIRARARRLGIQLKSAKD